MDGPLLISMDTSRIPILSIYINTGTENSFLERCREWLTVRDGAARQIVTVNPEFIMESRRNRRFAEVLNGASLALADGFGILCASVILFGSNLFTRITGVQATLLLCKLAEAHGKSVYLVGAREGVAARTAEALKKRFPSLIIAGAEVGIPLSGTRTPTEYTDELVSRINAASPDILFVAFGAPKQELWLAENLHRCPTIRIALGVGGTFDYLSGAVAYAPAWIRTVGLEWLYRLIREPRRLNRIISATVRFPCAIIGDKVASVWRSS